MFIITITGLACVFDKNEKPISDKKILTKFNGVIYDEEQFTTYIGGPEKENELAAALFPGGTLNFTYPGSGTDLAVTTEYKTRRKLTKSELKLLVDYTMGQWSDGIGENWVGESFDKYGYAIQCLTPGDIEADEYPTVKITLQH